MSIVDGELKTILDASTVVQFEDRVVPSVVDFAQTAAFDTGEVMMSGTVWNRRPCTPGWPIELFSETGASGVTRSMLNPG